MGALTGTNRQIIWGEQIRSEFVARTENSLKVQEGGLNVAPPQAGERGERVMDLRRRRFAWTQQAIEAAADQTDAAWWINNRNKTLDGIYEALVGPRPR